MISSNIPEILARLSETRELGGSESASAPAQAEVLRREGFAAMEAGRYPQAILALSQSIELRPDHAETHGLLGRAYAATACVAAAEDAYRSALRLNPGLAETHVRLAELLEQQSRHEEAELAYREAARLAPGDAQAKMTLARDLCSLGRLDEALRLYQELARDRRQDVDAHYGLGNALLRLRRPQEALAAYRRARELAPHIPKALFAEASPLLTLGEFDAGWDAYEARLRMRGGRWKVADVLDRLWEGGPLAGRRLLVHAEQGFGDTLQFIRYMPMLRRREGPEARIAFLCEPELARTLATVEGCEDLHAPRQLGPIGYDCQLPLLSLPHRFRTNLASIPLNVPYLRLPQDASLPIECPDAAKLRVGFVWAGSPSHSDNLMRSCPLEHFAGLFDLPGAYFYSLQVGERSAEIAPYLDRPNVTSMAEKLADFADTLAVVDQMDLVIAVDTSIVHLAGAYGKPVWTLLAFGGEWRWLLDREDSPWYPTMRLFRQASPGDWDGVFRRVRKELEDRLAASAPEVELSSPSPVGDSTALVPAPMPERDTPIRFKDYVLENAYHRTGEAQRREIMAFWLEQGAVPDPNERARRSHEVVLMVRNAAGELAGLSTVDLKRAGDGRIFYAYRMFLRPRDRVPYLMWSVTDGTRDFLRNFTHPQGPVAGLMIVTENPKLMRPGMKRDFQRHGYRYQGKTPQGMDVWVAEFDEAARA